MAYELITSRNLSEGLHVPFIYVNDITGGIFIKLLLFMVWCIVAFGVYFAQKKGIGLGDAPVSVAVASFVTVILTILLGLIPGMVDATTYVITIVITIVTTLWLFLSRD